MISVTQGEKSFTDLEAQTIIQVKLEKSFPAWKRERSLRKNDGEFNAFMESVEDDINAFLETNTFNQKLADYKKAQSTLEGPVGLRGRKDAKLRTQAQAVVDATPQAVKDFEG